MSQAKHWCTICRVWTGGHKGQILKHETGRAHIENEERSLKDARTRQNSRDKEEKDIASQLAEIERAALAAMVKDAAPPRAAGQQGGGGGGAGTGRPPGAAGMDQVGQKRHIEEVIASAKKRKIDPIAAAWTKHHDPTSKVAYYYNSITLASSWVVPAGYVEPEAPPKPRDGPSADGSPWSRSTDPTSGTQYYYNSATKESSWDRPGNFVDPTDDSGATFANTTTSTSTSRANPLTGQTMAEQMTSPSGVPAAAALAAVEAAKPAANMGGDPIGPGAGPAPRTLLETLAAAGSPWVVCTDASNGYIYYFNKLTKESTYDKPADLAVDISKPPPAPPKNTKPPPPPKTGKAAEEGVVGAWEEVVSSNSMWDAGRIAPKAADEPDSEDEDAVDPLTALKYLTMQKGAWMDEDHERHEKQVEQKASSSTSVATVAGKVDLNFGTAASMKVKKAGGLRKREDEDEFRCV